MSPICESKYLSIMFFGNRGCYHQKLVSVLRLSVMLMLKQKWHQEGVRHWLMCMSDVSLKQENGRKRW